MSLPTIVTREEWLAARKELLAREKQLTHERDAINAARRRLPMVEITEDYRFEGPDGEAGLLDLFDGRRQLLVYHFMWLFDEGAGCPSCSFLVDNIGDLAHLHARDTSLAVVSRGPFAEIDAYRRRMGWSVPFYSSSGSSFNYDFHVTSTATSHRPSTTTSTARTTRLRGLEGRAAGHERVPPRRRPRVPHLLQLRPRRRPPARHLRLARPDRARAPGGLGAAAGRSDGAFMHWVRRHDEYEGARRRVSGPSLAAPALKSGQAMRTLPPRRIVLLLQRLLTPRRRGEQRPATARDATLAPDDPVRAHAELGEDVPEVVLDRLRRQVELGADLAVRTGRRRRAPRRPARGR